MIEFVRGARDSIELSLSNVEAPGNLNTGMKALIILGTFVAPVALTILLLS